MMKEIFKKNLRILFVVMTAIPLTWSLCLGQSRSWPKSMTIAGGTLGGAVFLYSGGLAKMIYEKMGIATTVEVTGGSVHNAKLIDNNEVAFGPSQAPSVYDAWNGLDWAKGKKYQNLRAVFHQNNSYFQIYFLKKSGIKTIYDLSGKSIGVGPTGSGPNVYYRQVFEELGIKPSRFVHASHSDIQAQLIDGIVDASASVSSVPWVVVKETEAAHEVNVLGVNRNDMQKLKKFVQHYPFAGIDYIPKGTYKANQNYDIESIIFSSFYYTHKSTPDDLVYEVVKKAFENKDYLIAAHPSAKEAKPENIIYCAVPVHPGAVRYYKEKGIKIPDQLLPPQ